MLSSRVERREVAAQAMHSSREDQRFSANTEGARSEASFLRVTATCFISQNSLDGIESIEDAGTLCDVDRSLLTTPAGEKKYRKANLKQDACIKGARCCTNR